MTNLCTYPQWPQDYVRMWWRCVRVQALHNTLSRQGPCTHEGRPGWAQWKVNAKVDLKMPEHWTHSPTHMQIYQWKEPYWLVAFQQSVWINGCWLTHVKYGATPKKQDQTPPPKLDPIGCDKVTNIQNTWHLTKSKQKTSNSCNFQVENKEKPEL